MTATGGTALVVVAVGGRRFALPGPRVREITRIDAVTPVPCDDPANLGVALHRERVLPLVDLRRRLGLGPAEPGPRPPLCVVARTADGDVGFPIDAVLEFIPSGQLPPADDVRVVWPDGFGGEPWRASC